MKPVLETQRAAIVRRVIPRRADDGLARPARWQRGALSLLFVLSDALIGIVRVHRLLPVGDF